MEPFVVVAVVPLIVMLLQPRVHLLKCMPGEKAPVPGLWREEVTDREVWVRKQGDRIPPSSLGGPFYLYKPFK